MNASNVIIMHLSQRLPVLNVHLESNCDYVSLAQERTLLNIVRSHAVAPFGLAHHFDDIMTWEDFKRWVPLQRALVEPARLMVDESKTLMKHSAVLESLGYVSAREFTWDAWFDLRRSLAQAIHSLPIGRQLTFDTAIEILLHECQNRCIEVLIGPTHWVTALFSHFRSAGYTNIAAPRACAAVFEDLRLVIAVSHSSFNDRTLIAELGRGSWSVPVLRAYATPDGISIGIETAANSGVFALLSSAGAFFEFIPQSAPNNEQQRLPLWQVECGELYTLCLTTRRGLFGHVTNQYVRFMPTAWTSEVTHDSNAPVAHGSSLILDERWAAVAPGCTLWQSNSVFEC